MVSKVLSWFGRYSLELYLLHVMIRKMLNLNDLPTTHLRYEAVVIIGAIAPVDTPETAVQPDSAQAAAWETFT